MERERERERNTFLIDLCHCPHKEQQRVGLLFNLCQCHIKEIIQVCIRTTMSFNL